MKKIIFLSFLFAVSTVYTVFADSRDDAKPPFKTAVKPPMASRTLKVLNYFDMTRRNAKKDITEIWDKYMSAHPDITIEREDIFDDSFHNKTEAYAVAGQLPDVVFACPSGRSMWLYGQKLLKDLTPLIKKDGLDQKYFPLATNPSQFGSSYAGIFYGYVGILTQSLTSSHAFYVNNEVLKAAELTPVKTYDELKAQVPILKAKGYETVLMANQDYWVMQTCLFSMLAGRFGGADWADKIRAGTAKFTDPDFLNALKFVKQMYDDGVLAKSTLSTDYGSVVGLFAHNKGAYFIDGDWRVGAFITDKTTGQANISPERQKNIQITVFPDITGAKLNKSTSGLLGTGYGISAAIPEGSPKEAAAWDLVKWLSGPEAQQYWVDAGYISTPSWKNLDISKLSLEPMQKAVLNLPTQYTALTPVIAAVFDGAVYTALYDGLQAIGYGLKTPEQVAAETQAAFETW